MESTRTHPYHTRCLPFRFDGAAFHFPVPALTYPSGSTAVLSGSTAEAPQAVVLLAVFGCSTAVVPGYYRLDSRPLFLISGSAVLEAAVVAVVPLQAVVPLVLPR